MGQGLKQRLLGVVILLGVLVILAPALFQGGSEHPLVRLEEKALPEAPDKPAFVASLSTEADEISVVEVDSTPPPPVNTGVDEKGYLKAWALQLATFSDKSNATRLEDALKAGGYTAYTRRYQRSDGQALFKVYIGPEVRQTDLLKVKPILDRQYNVSSLLVKFVP